METLFIEAKKILNSKEKEKIKKVVEGFRNKFTYIKKIGLVASIQYIDFLKEFRRYLEKEKIKTFVSHGRLTSYNGQILGCDIIAAKRIAKKVDAFLIVTSGNFHALQLALQIDKPIFVYNQNTIYKIDEKEIERIRKKRKGTIAKLLNAREIGILVSIKPGQENLIRAIKIKRKIEKKGKKAFIFITNTLQPQELENFSCECWINTACSTLIFDSSKLVNWEEVRHFF